MSKPDLVLLHPPSVYDFRKEFKLYGPISEVVPSTPVFEMYPFGFATIAGYLETRGYRARIVNLGLRMMNNPSFDVERFIASLRPRAFGIGLHWLCHAHGAVEMAKLAKAQHPDDQDGEPESDEADREEKMEKEVGPEKVPRGCVPVDIQRQNRLFFHGCYSDACSAILNQSTFPPLGSMKSPPAE